MTAPVVPPNQGGRVGGGGMVQPYPEKPAGGAQPQSSQPVIVPDNGGTPVIDLTKPKQ
jgi:hypothetical protein